MGDICIYHTLELEKSATGEWRTETPCLNPLSHQSAPGHASKELRFRLSESFFPIEPTPVQKYGTQLEWKIPAIKAVRVIFFGLLFLYFLNFL